jgi:hypothetical protein
MPTTLSFKESYQVLETNPKTFTQWLIKAGIDANAQVNLVDPRKKYLTKAQIMQLAEAHGRILPASFYEEEAEPPVLTVERLAEQQASFRDEVTQQLNRIEQLLEGIASKEPTVHPSLENSRLEQIQQVLTQVVASLSTTNLHGQWNSTQKQEHYAPDPVPALAAVTGATTGRGQRTAVSATSRPSHKKSSRKKRLPRGLILLRDFAGLHNIKVERASAAGKAGKIAIIQGKWLINSRWATEALDAQGQRDFFETFHEHASFQHCEECEHSLSS